MKLESVYAQAAKRIGPEEAHRRFDEVAVSGLEILDLGVTISKRDGMLRHRYQEEIPWEDCLIAATSIESRSDYVITEDQEFKSFKEINSKKIEELGPLERQLKS